MFVLVAAALQGCGSPVPVVPEPTPLAAPAAEAPAPAVDHSMHKNHANHADMPAGTPVPGESVYQLTSGWVDQAGRSLKLGELAGTPRIIAMVYTHCEFACPRIVADMRNIQTDLGEDAKKVGFVLVSIDPARDSVERMATFARETGIDAEGWRVIRGDDGDVRELAAVLGVQYKRVSDDDFAHSNLIHVLDGEGRLVHRQEGLGTTPAETVTAIRALL